MNALWRARPRLVVALGGGTGLPAVLRGLRGVAAAKRREALTAVVAMSDDGGSSGRLRRSMGMPPPGDVRNCLVALAEEEDLLAALFQYRYEGGDELGGHTLGNLILAALAEQTGSFMRAVEVSSSVLRTVGRILPVTEDDVRLVATLDDGERIVGETAIATCGRKVRSVSLQPRDARATPGVVEAIEAADLIVLGPGSLFSSIVPTVVIDEVGRALRESGGAVVLVGNLVTERGEDAGLDILDHLRVIEEHAGGRFIDAVLLNDGPIGEGILERYRAEGAAPQAWPERNNREVVVVRRNLLADGPKLRHDPASTAEGLIAVWSTLAATAVTDRNS